MVFTTISNAKALTGLSYLGRVNSSAKLLKNGKISGQHTYGLYLSPAEVSGYNVCSHSTPECRMGCLATSGRAAMDIISGKNKVGTSRNKKTRLFFEDREFFMKWLIAEISVVKETAIKSNYGFSVRLNCTSDIDWANVRIDGKNVFEIFPDVNFYDYTKNHRKFIDKPSNYHLTYSYTGRNWITCKSLLSKGINVAMVFNVKSETELPLRYKGYVVINGDATDYRIDDSKGVIIGLKWKRIANREAQNYVLNSCFVVNVHDNRMVDMSVKLLEMAV